MGFRRLYPRGLIACAGLVLAWTGVQATESTVPPPGIREHTPAVHALINARIVTAPGRVIERGSIVVRDGVITGLGKGIAIPADARVWDLSGRTIYPGLIDAYTELGGKSKSKGKGRDKSSGGSDGDSPGTPKSGGGANYWNKHVTPQIRAERLYTPDDDANESYRSQGITARLLAPAQGIIKGTSALVSTADAGPSAAILKAGVALHVKLTTVRVRGESG